MTKLIYGYGKLRTHHGHIEGEGKIIGITQMPEAQPIGATEKDWQRQIEQGEFDVILVFKNLESLRVLQDHVSELAAEWSREINPQV